MTLWSQFLYPLHERQIGLVVEVIHEPKDLEKSGSTNLLPGYP